MANTPPSRVRATSGLAFDGCSDLLDPSTTSFGIGTSGIEVADPAGDCDVEGGNVMVAVVNVTGTGFPRQSDGGYRKTSAWP